MNPVSSTPEFTGPWVLLWNSVLVAGGATLGAIVLGSVAALFLIQAPGIIRKTALALIVAALMMPPFLVTSCWLHLLGFTGIWRPWLPLDIYSLPGAVLILALMTWPITALLLGSAWSGVDREGIEIEPLLAGRTLLTKLLYPAGKSALAQSIVLTFILTLNNFAVPALLQIKVYTASLWVSFNTTFDYCAAFGLSWPLILTPIILLLLLARNPLRYRTIGVHASTALFSARFGKPLRAGLAISFGLLIVLSIVLPATELIATSGTWSQLAPAFNAGKRAFFNSALFATGTATLCLIVALLLARFRWAVVLWIPFILPGLFLGMAVLWFHSPILNFLLRSVLIVFVTLGLRYLVILWTTSCRSIEETDPEILDAARLSGASTWKIFQAIHWPRIFPQLFAGWYLTYLLCLWDAETLILVIPPGAETLSLRIFNMLHYGHTTQVNALCLLLLGVALLPLALWGIAHRAAFSRRCAGSMLALLLICGCDSRSESNEVKLNSKFFSSVQVLGSRGVGAGEFNKPRSLICDREDNLFVVDMTGRVQKFSPEGQFLKSWQMPQTDKGKPKGMALDSSGNIIVVEPHYSRVNHFSREGNLVKQWGDNGTNAGQLAFPRSVAVASTGEIFLSEYGIAERIQKFSSDGSKYLLSFGSLGEKEGELSRGEGISIGRADELIEADSCNHRIQIFSTQGVFRSAFGRAGTAPGEMSYPYDVKMDAAGYIYVCEFGNSRIQIFDPEHHSVEILGSVGGSPGEMDNPWSIAFNSHGDLYVADSGNHRVQKFIRRARVARRDAGVSVAGP